MRESNGHKPTDAQAALLAPQAARALKERSHAGGWHAVGYTWKKAREVGLWKLWRAMRTKNACKTCAVGMGGQAGGMVNEAGHFPEVCKKSLQAMVADMQGAIKPDFWSTYSIPQMQQFSPREMEACGRLTTPVVLEPGSQYYRPIEWEDALGRISAKLKALAPEQTFWYFSGRSSNEAGFLLQLLARLYGTNNVNNCSFYCHQASGVGLTSVTGSGTATIELEDLAETDCVFLIGGNPASNHPRLMTMLNRLRRRGGECIVINPVVEVGLVNFRVPSDVRSLLFGSKIASLYVQPNIGGDLALLCGIGKRIVEMGATDEAFLAAACEGADAVKAQLAAMTWQEIEAKSGVAKSQIDEIAARYAKAKNVVFAWTMGITHHANGVENVQAIGNLALLRGMVGKRGAGLLPIRGHSNVQGIGSVGVTPKLKAAFFERLEKEFAVKLPTTPGLDTLGCMDQALSGALRFGLCLGGNLYGSNPDARYAAESLSKLDQLVYLNTSLNTGHAHGLARETIILPVLARDEEPQATTQESMFNYIRLSDGGPRRHAGPRSEIDIVATLGAAVVGKVGPLDWNAMQQAGAIRSTIARVAPGFEEIEKIGETKKEFAVGGRIFHQGKFATADGRAKMHVVYPPELPLAENELRVMTVRSEGQFNTVVYEDGDIYRGQERRDVILLHPDDVARLGLAANQRVEVRSAAGSMPGILVRPYDKIKAGNALMYYPEANVLVSRQVDPQSRTPAFKNVVVTLHAAR